MKNKSSKGQVGIDPNSANEICALLNRLRRRVPRLNIERRERFLDDFLVVETQVKAIRRTLDGIQSVVRPLRRAPLPPNPANQKSKRMFRGIVLSAQGTTKKRGSWSSSKHR